MISEITLVDRGRGLQLSTSRITVMDLVPYFQQGCSAAEIIRWIPTLTADEIAVVEEYYRTHRQQLDEQDRQVEEFRKEQVRLQRLRFPESQESKQERMDRLRKLLHDRKEASGERNTC